MKIQDIERLEDAVKMYEYYQNDLLDRDIQRVIQDRVLYYLKTEVPIDEIISHLHDKYDEQQKRIQERKMRYELERGNSNNGSRKIQERSFWRRISHRIQGITKLNANRKVVANAS